MKTLLTICFLALFSTAVYVSMPINDKSSDLGICVDKLSDCSGKRIDIVSEPNMQKEHKIVVVPTIIIFNEGEEVKRFQANIMMQLEASEQDVQEVIDEILMSSF